MTSQSSAKSTTRIEILLLIEHLPVGELLEGTLSVTARGPEV
jgi:hypothetical protein